jgi:peptide/nickel transport system substrate-binding protein
LGQEDFDWASLLEHEARTNPTVTGGMFQFNRLDAGTAVYLDFNPNYFEGTTVPAGWIFLDVPDEAVMTERFLAGGENDPNFIREPNGGAIITTLKESDVQTVAAPGNIWHYVSINNADPENPQDAFDEGGAPIDQGHHPFFGDVRVRQALQHAINIDEIISGPLGNNAYPMIAGTISNAWTFDSSIERRAFDLDAARALLDEAGFPATGDPLVEGGDGQRVASGAMYAEDGTEFYIEIINPGGVRNDVSVILQDQFAQIGVKADVVALDFNTLYADNMGVQTYDLAVAGWRGGVPFNPDQREIFGVAQDVADAEGYGNNFGSYNNPEFEELSGQMQTLPGCDPEARKAIASQIQNIFYEDQPYLWLYQLESVYSTKNGVENFMPYTAFGAWNGNEWRLVQE